LGSENLKNFMEHRLTSHIELTVGITDNNPHKSEAIIYQEHLSRHFLFQNKTFVLLLISDYF
jgi:hypothetical protein